MCVKAVNIFRASGRCSGSKKVSCRCRRNEYTEESLFLASLPDLASVGFT